MKYQYITNKEDLYRVVIEIDALIPNTYIALDTETYANYNKTPKATAIDPHMALIRLISLYWSKRAYLIDVKLIEDVSELLRALSREDLIKISHNASFDIRMFKSHFGISLPSWYCTLVASNTLNVSTGWKIGQIRRSRLLDLARDLYNINLDKHEQRSDWSGNLTKNQLDYAAIDVMAPDGSPIDSILIQAFIDIRQACIELNQLESFELDQKVMRITTKAEYNGLPISINLLEDIRDSILPRVEQLQENLLKQLNIPLERRLVFEDGIPNSQIVIPEWASKLLNNNAKLVGYINEKIIKHKLTDLQAESLIATLNILDSEDDIDEDVNTEASIELIKNLLAYKRLAKLGSEATKYIHIRNPVTGRVHTNLKPVGTSTSRMASRGEDTGQAFNLQQISTFKVDIHTSIDRMFMHEASESNE